MNWIECPRCHEMLKIGTKVCSDCGLVFEEFGNSSEKRDDEVAISTPTVVISVIAGK
jgi:transcription initiation factor TFIIIB Brf1 subunit/transcription initiation factor TFIIB